MTDPMLNLSGQRPPPEAASSSLLSDLGGGVDGSASLPAGEVFGSVLYYSSLILFLPLVAFFATRNLLLGLLVAGVEQDSVTSNVASAAVAVVVLHLALGLFIYKAYFQQAEAPKARIGKQE